MFKTLAHHFRGHWRISVFKHSHPHAQTEQISTIHVTLDEKVVTMSSKALAAWIRVSLIYRAQPKLAYHTHAGDAPASRLPSRA